MLDKAILELNGIFNVPPNVPKRQNNGKTEPLQRVSEEQEYVHPIIIPGDIRDTMSNYLKASDSYNKKADLENHSIKTQNKRVDKSRCKKPLQDSEMSALNSFYNMISPLNTWERNERVAEYNRCNGSEVAKMETIKTLKYPTQVVFQHILWHYSQQLYKRKEVRQRVLMNIPGTLPHVEIHSGWITSEKIKEERRLKVSIRTLRRQRKRLQEAGILQDYLFEGSSRPVKVRINPEILHVTDNHSTKKTAPENQLFIPDGRTECPHNNVSNRTLINNIEIKANVSQHSEIRSSAQKGLTSLYLNSTGNTRTQSVKKNDANAEKNATSIKKSKLGPEKNTTSTRNSTPGAEKDTLSYFLRRKIEEKTDFADKLAAHEYDSYVPLRKDILEKEAVHGSLDREEFKELIIQDFFKSAAKLYRSGTPYMASWLKGYNEWIQKKFINPSGFPLKKLHLVEKVDELRYGLTAVGRFLKKHPDYNLLYPGEYFDLTRTTAKEGGFKYYAGEAWRKNQDYLKNKTDDSKLKSIKRKRKNSDLQKAQRHVKTYLTNKISFDELCTKVQQIGNNTVYQDLPEIIKKANLKFQLKNS